jgi:hypothetical protein
VSASVATFIKGTSLSRLRELQLLMFGMANSNLADIFSFLKTCSCPHLERLFVQVANTFPSTSSIRIYLYLGVLTHST